MNPKQDRPGARTPEDLERKYNFGENFHAIKKAMQQQSKELEKQNQWVTNFVGTTSKVLQELDENYDKLLEKSSTMERTVQNCDTKVTEFDTKVTGLDTNVTELNAKVEEIEKLELEFERMETELEELDSAVTELNRKVEDLENIDPGGGSTPQVTGTVPAGVILPFAGSTAPSGFLLCDGKAYSRETYSELFAAIGTTYGTGDRRTTFNVPNLAGRVPVGTGSGYALGATGGEEKHTLTVDEIPSHYHPTPDIAPGLYAGWGTKSGSGWVTASVQGTGGNWYTDVTGGGQSHNNMQPYAVVNYIIATGK